MDAAIVDGSAHMMALLMSMAPNGHLVTERGKSLLDGPHWSRVYTCADGGYLSVQCLEAKFYAIFLDVLGLRDDPRFADQYDVAKWPAQTREMAQLFAREPVRHWADLFDGTDACVAPVLPPEEAAQEPPYGRARGLAEGAAATGPCPAIRWPRGDARPGPGQGSARRRDPGRAARQGATLTPPVNCTNRTILPPELYNP